MALFVLLYQAGSSLASCIQHTLQWNQMSFCQRHNFQVDKVPPEDGGWIGGRQNLWLIASLMWQGPAVWGNWSALRVDTFCVSLSCRLLLAWPWGPGAGQFTLQTLRGQHQLFYCGYWLGPASPLWLICLLTSAWSVPASILSLCTPSSPHSVSSDTYFKPSLFFCAAPCSPLVQYTGPIY